MEIRGAWFSAGSCWNWNSDRHQRRMVLSRRSCLARDAGGITWSKRGGSRPEQACVRIHTKRQKATAQGPAHSGSSDGMSRCFCQLFNISYTDAGSPGRAETKGTMLWRQSRTSSGAVSGRETRLCDEKTRPVSRRCGPEGPPGLWPANPLHSTLATNLPCGGQEKHRGDHGCWLVVDGVVPVILIRVVRVPGVGAPGRGKGVVFLLLHEVGIGGLLLLCTL